MHEATPFTFHPMDEAAARAVLAWRYPAPYDVYNEAPERIEQVVHEVLRPEYHYHRLAEGDDTLVAYCCFGLDARVSGGDYAMNALDLGLMVRPDLTGQGRGQQFAAAVLAFAQREFPQKAWRVTIAEFNRRAQRVWQKLDFRHIQTFARQGDGLAFGTWILDGAQTEVRYGPRRTQRAGERRASLDRLRLHLMSQMGRADSTMTANQHRTLKAQKAGSA